ETSVHRWRRMARQDSGLDAKPHPGRKPLLSQEQLVEVRRLLLQGPKEHGWPNNLWTAARVAEVITRHFGVEYHPSHVSRILTEPLNWTCHKPLCQRRDPDDTAIETWVRERFPEVAQEAEARNAYLVFVDETGFMLEPTVRRTYAPRGK